MSPGDAIFVTFDWTADARPGDLAGEWFRAVDGARGCAYLEGTADAAALTSLPGAAVSRLRLRQDIAGASAGLPPRFHYVVRTDVNPVCEADFNAWYETEHLPGLAAVPGTVRARRFRTVDGVPRYHACYDLVETQTIGSPPWLAVRGTAWSSRVRPAFRNTTRDLYVRAERPGVAS